MTAFRQAYIGGKEWFSQSGLPDEHIVSPHVYARRLTRYISDASTVRARTVDHFGRAPGIEVIRKMRADWLDLLKTRAQEQAEHGLVLAGPVPQLQLVRPVDIEPEPKPEPPALPPVAARGFMLHTGRDVIDACADACDISHGELIGSMRNVEFTRGRNLAAAVLRARGNSLPNVGRLLGGRDHSTVMNAIDRFFSREMKDPRFVAAWETLAPCVFKSGRTVAEMNAMLVVRL